MISIITTTLPSQKAALKLSKKMLQQNLIGCSHLHKVISQYNWKGKYYEEKEYKLVVKTSISKRNQVVKYIKKNHPYEVPYIASSDVSVNNSYSSWMDSL